MPSSRQPRRISKIRRGEIWWVNLDPRHGTEPGKTRPVLVVQAQTLLDAGYSSTLVIPLTTKLIDDAEPLRLRVGRSAGLRQDSDLLVAQLRAIDNRRFVRGPLATLPERLMMKTDEAIHEALGLLPK